jgi:hypothetical protein
VPSSALIKRTYWGVQILLLAASAGAAAWFSRPQEWRPLALVAVLLALTLVGEWLSIETHSGALNPAFYAVTLSMILLGPTPAVAFGVALQVLTSARRRLRPAFWLGNLTAFTVVPIAGGWLVRALAGDVHDPHNLYMVQGLTFALIAYGVFLLVHMLNFVLIGLDVRVIEGRPLRAEIRELFFPLLSGELAAGVLVTGLALAYTNLGVGALAGGIVLFAIFRYLMVALLRSEERAEKLEASTLQLAGMQWGVLKTLARVVNARDATAGPHAAAVARYAKALAVELGCSESEQDVVHTAALLHEVGKFGWPDRILNEQVASSEDLQIVKNHPQEGAALVGALHGYGDVADAILYHHERIDGTGYPAGLIGKEIPLASRILAICSAYDTMSAGRPYRPAMLPAEAMEELRTGARNGQLDPELVERFVGLLERDGTTFGKDSDFETEFEFDRRVRSLAEPRPADPVLSEGRRLDPRRLRATASRLGQDALHKARDRATGAVR